MSQRYAIGSVSGTAGRRHGRVYHVKHAVALVEREELDLSCNTQHTACTR